MTDAPPPPPSDPGPDPTPDAIPDPGAEAAFALFNDIGIVSQLATARLRRALPEGMEPAHFHVLNHFARLGGERAPAELARAFQVGKATMTNTVQRLAAAGYVAVRPDPRDGRAKRVSLTPAGLAARDRAVAALAPDLAALVPVIGADRIARLAPDLKALRELLDRARDADPPEA